MELYTNSKMPSPAVASDNVAIRTLLKASSKCVATTDGASNSGCGVHIYS